MRSGTKIGIRLTMDMSANARRHSQTAIIFDWDGQKRRRIDFEIDAGGWNNAGDVYLIPLRHALKGNMRVMNILPGKLHLQIGMANAFAFGRVAHAIHLMQRV